MSCSDGGLSFAAYNSFRLGYAYEGGYKVTKSDGSEILSYTSFDFSAFQRETSFDISIGASYCKDADHPCELEVSNKIKDKTSTSFVCS